MLPEAKSENLLYAANANAWTVTVYGYRTHALAARGETGC